MYKIQHHIYNKMAVNKRHKFIGTNDVDDHRSQSVLSLSKRYISFECNSFGIFFLKITSVRVQTPTTIDETLPALN